MDVDAMLRTRSWSVEIAALVSLTSDRAQETVSGAPRTSEAIALRIEVSLPDIASKPEMDAVMFKGSITDEIRASKGEAGKKEMLENCDKGLKQMLPSAAQPCPAYAILWVASHISHFKAATRRRAPNHQIRETLTWAS